MRYDHLSMLPDLAFAPIGKRMTLEGGKGGGSPKAPDYAKLAQEQAQQQLMLNRSTTQANRVDQFTPFGSLTYQQGSGGEPYFDQAAYDAALAQYNRQGAAPSGRVNPLGNLGGLGGWEVGRTKLGATGGSRMAAPDRNSFYRTGGNPDQWSSTVTLNPEVQKIVDQRLSAQQQGYDELQQYLSDIGDESVIPRAVVNPGQTAQQAIMARLNPQFQTQEEDVRTRLYNQGVRPGTEAWDNEFRNFSQGRNDAYSQAALYGINLDNQARERALQEQLLPMNAIQGYANGTQVQMPQFTDYAQQANVAAPDLMGAGQAAYGADMNAYNADQAAQANTMSGLFSLGGALGTAMLFSDRRLKKNIHKIGNYANGLTKYSFEYLWGDKAIGAMADEVEKFMPQAVGRMGEFKTVNYAMLGA